MTTKTNSKRANLAPLIVDVAVPIGAYYLLKDGLGASTLMALGLSSVVPAVRTGWSVVKERAVNGLAALILVVNVVGLLLSLVAGDPRLMLAKDSGVSSVIGIGILVSVALGRPMMTAGMKPWLVKGIAEREAAWARLQDGSADFRRAERRFSVVWGSFCSRSVCCGSWGRTRCPWTRWSGSGPSSWSWRWPWPSWSAGRWAPDPWPGCCASRRRRGPRRGPRSPSPDKAE